MIHDWVHKKNTMTHTTQALRDRKGQVEQQVSVDRLVRVELTVSSGFGGEAFSDPKQSKELECCLHEETTCRPIRVRNDDSHCRS